MAATPLPLLKRQQNNHARYQSSLYLLDFYGAYASLMTTWSEVAEPIELTGQKSRIAPQSFAAPSTRLAVKFMFSQQVASP
jgi:hypothetical protein